MKAGPWLEALAYMEDHNYTRVRAFRPGAQARLAPPPRLTTQEQGSGVTDPAFLGGCLSRTMPHLPGLFPKLHPRQLSNLCSGFKLPNGFLG